MHSLHPAVLNAIHYAIKEAHLHGKPVSVCGEMAGDPAGALLLLGMGVDALSMSPASLPQVKLVIRSFTLQRARSLHDEAHGMEDGFAIHRLLNGALEEVGVLTGRQTTGLSIAKIRRSRTAGFGCQFSDVQQVIPGFSSRISCFDPVASRYLGILGAMKSAIGWEMPYSSSPTF